MNKNVNLQEISLFLSKPSLNKKLRDLKICGMSDATFLKST
jgi:hypothetical protein